MAEMVMKVPSQVNIEMLGEIITAVTHFRYDNKHGYGQEYLEQLEPSHKDYFENGYMFYSVPSEFVTLEMIDVIEDIKKLLPIETYFEAEDTLIKSDRDDNRGEIYDSAIYSLYLEKAHNRKIA